ncbi:TonB-dependent receptor [Algibacter miyuki]|uniref:TonB-dependent receptor n=1 Tax=Algibacter miyuki TaxID=1306933 RepID=A0ABV5GV15_9FLAO|nr:TonB-dependent receptor plug domain-containing protein [Algibacter miyuki]MDN3664805.1 TonB-dependent receptor [Algibacter miyuki]
MVSVKTLVSFLLFTLSFSAFTQNGDIYGNVKFDNNEVVLGAYIMLNGTSIKKETNSGVNGEFYFKNVPYGTYSIQFHSLDAKVKTINVTLDSNKKVVTAILAFTKQQDLQEIRVNGKTEKVKKETQGFAVNIVETKEASLRNIQTNELLNTTVGVKIRQNGGLGSHVQYTLNGLSGGSVRIFIDGIPISMYGSSFSLNSIPPSMIKNIEVYKGVIPGHLADDALGGAINVVLHKGTKTHFNASVSYGSFNTIQTSLNGLYRFEKSGFTVKASAFHNYSDNDYKVWGGQVMDIAQNGRQTPITARRFYDAYKSTGGMAQIGYTDVKWADQFLIGFTGSEDYKEIQHGAFMTLHPYKGRFSETDAKLANLTYQKKDLFTEGFDVNVTGLYGKRTTVVNDTVAAAYTWKGERLVGFDGEFLDYTWGSQQEGGPTLNTTKRNVASIRTGLSYKINNNHKVLVNHIYSGLDREDSDEMKSLLENTFKQTSDLYKNIYSLSYELNTFENKLKLNIFGKHYRQNVLNTMPVFNNDNTEVIDEVFKSDTDFNGYGFAASYAIVPKIILLTSAEKAVRLPNETEVFGDVAGNVEANLDVQAEVSDNYNFGFRFGKFHIEKHAFTISTNFFTRNIENLIGFASNADRIIESSDELVHYDNFDEGTTSKGVEAEINYSYNNNLGFNFNFSRLTLESKNRAGNIVDIPNTPLFTMNSGLRYSIKNFLQKESRLNLFYNTYFTEEFSYIMSQGTNVSGLDAFLVPTQFIQDLGLSYTFPKENFVVSFDAKNIFNKAAYDNQSIQKPGRAFYLKLNYTINKF